MKAERLLDDLNSRLDIVDVVSDYIELKRAGQNYKGLCPFHSEKTPSFMVSPDKQIFHCFGCGVGGNLVHFVMKYENLSFQESLRLLAKKAGINLKEYKFNSSSNNEGLREKLAELHREATKVFVENLKRSKVAQTYLRERGLTEDTIRAFSIGYALKDWRHLSNYLKDKGFHSSFILQSGMVSSGDKGSYDTFRDRIIFPICDIQGDIIAFGGRVMDDSQPKYLNSADSPLFRKGETLYGLNLAKDGIRKKEYAIIVEGYLDVMMSHQCGFGNTVAPLGTALTPGHLQKLKRFTKKAVLVFDGDEAGKSAAKRSIPLLLEQGFAAKILLLPEKDDPDSFLRKNGNISYEKLLSKSKSVVEFILTISRKDKTETVHEAIEIISAAGDMIMKEELIGELSRKADKSETVIREEIKRIKKKWVTKGKITGGYAPAGPVSPPFLCDEELLLLSAAIAFPDRCHDILQKVSLEEFRNPMVRDLFRKLFKVSGKVDSILALLSDDEKMLITGLTLNPGFDPETVDKNIEDCVRRMVVKTFDERFKEAQGTGDPKLLNALLRERKKLIGEGASEKTGDF